MERLRLNKYGIDKFRWIVQDIKDNGKSCSCPSWQNTLINTQRDLSFMHEDNPSGTRQCLICRFLFKDYPIDLYNPCPCHNACIPSEVIISRFNQIIKQSE
jgi:hypothetical protein